ncbi:Histidinol dehydrogenase [Macleaya cordata]|uniref:histidinol dehydrogenase n=1 Tax=Macleaya cordata TaxID=56857 RepID=A0A200PMD1_MACCD|nr:Histidinol dehydrogenase [Macleaya cordata]
MVNLFMYLYVSSFTLEKATVPLLVIQHTAKVRYAKGPWTPESMGDYASGTNHVLPTYGYSRMYSGVSLDSFLKFITVQSLTEEGLRMLGPHVVKMAEVEGLEAHKRAVTLRLQDIEARLPV